MTRAIVFLLFGGLVGCSPGPESPETDSPPLVTAGTDQTRVAPEPAISPDNMARWTRNCALCHVRGEGGAPTLGDTEAWATRGAQGEDVLLAHTVEGLNNMPPLGYCMDCEEADLREIIRFMAGIKP